jgi:hypothetical protein
MEKKLKNLQTFEQYTGKNLNISDVSDSNIPQDIQSEYNILISRLRDGSADPGINYVEDRIEEIRKEYPNIKLKY